MSGKTQLINIIVDENLRKVISESRTTLTPIIDTIKLCGCRSLPLRGHQDDSKYHPKVGHYTQVGVGNFVELIHFRIRVDDKVLEDHLKSRATNATYISKKNQNELIKCCYYVVN